jgi:hypothetical protein
VAQTIEPSPLPYRHLGPAVSEPFLSNCLDLRVVWEETLEEHIDLVGNIGPDMLKPPFCKIRPRLVGFKGQTRAQKTGAAFASFEPSSGP